MLNFINIKSELKSRLLDTGSAAAAPDREAKVVTRDWDALSIAFMAQITAPLRLRSTTRDGLFG